MTDGARPEITERLELREQDIDSLGHLNQARYHDLLGAARRRLLRQGFPGATNGDGTFVIARTELDYHREVRLDDRWVDARARISRVGTKSVTIDNELVRPDGIVAARGQAVMVAWDREARRSRPLSDGERAAYGGE
jgi:acyl-CoA thioester hydrolase